ncbi:hypothetical protein [Shewanella xiamenensis]|uniref:hypothetical protein n=1 Tax=Shewanella xiamenensis TaxID=332186 RepID=UPI0021BFCA35|nr:hypothetical protein [Shewanella xiamenensis]MCT8876648.1 hypothetical protein [Shewanella xiamenensis]
MNELTELTELLNENAPEVELYKHCYYLVQSGIPKELIIDTCFQFNETHDHDNEYYGVVDNVMTNINEWFMQSFLSDIDTMEACMSGPILQVPINSFEEFSAWVDDNIIYSVIASHDEYINGNVSGVEEPEGMSDDQYDAWIKEMS